MALILAAGLLISLLNLQVLFATNSPWQYDGSTPNLKDIFLGRCYQYQQIDEKNFDPALQVTYNCRKLWREFRASFAYKDPCKLSQKDYEAYFKLVMHPWLTSENKLKDKAMFWSGSKEIVSDFTNINHNYVVLEDTFNGYLGNDLQWCGCTDCPKQDLGIGYKNCSGCNWKSVTPYWDTASELFAQQASGVAYVMLNGTQVGFRTAYYRKSTFGRIELPSLKVKLLRIIVIFSVDTKPREKCGTGSLVDLVEDAKKYGIETECYDEPVFVNMILCVKYPHAEQCKKFQKGNDQLIPWQ